MTQFEEIFAGIVSNGDVIYTQHEFACYRFVVCVNVPLWVQSIGY